MLVSAQQTQSRNNLQKQANDNFELLNTEPKKAFENAIEIAQDAQKTKDTEAELKAVHTQCGYYRIINDFENMMESAQILAQKSIEYKSAYYRVIAKRYLFESYLFTGLPDRAFKELKEAEEAVSKLDNRKYLTIIERINLSVAYSNYYLLKDDYPNQLKYIKQAGVELNRLPAENPNYNKNELLQVHYSNLASSFSMNNIKDSAKHYAMLSQSIPLNEVHNEVKFNNLSVLGDVSMSEENYEEALDYYHAAEKIRGYRNHLDIEKLYDDISLAYNRLGKPEYAETYSIKKDSLRLSISENQNKSLHKLLNEKSESSTRLYFYILLAFIGGLGIFSFILIRKNKILAAQEKLSTRYLEEIAKNPSGEDYSKLLNLLKENDPAFMAYFEETFPTFSAALQEINPKITEADIEFCALLKLKIPTKDIARYKFRAPQTVRNKKYIIKNKLNIPKEIDIYEWFDSV